MDFVEAGVADRRERRPEMMTSETQVAVASAESQIVPDLELARLAPIWDGILHEFRNHLIGLLAVADAIRAVAPAAAGDAIAIALAEALGSVQRLDALVGFVDTAGYLVRFS